MARPELRAHARELALEAIIEISRAENAGDEFACLEEHDCIHPGGHLFLTSCGETKCVHCGRISWT